MSGHEQPTIEEYLPGPDGWVSKNLDEVIAQLAREGHPFTADDVRQDRFGIGDEGETDLRNGDLGAAFNRARLRGLIECVGYRSSTRRSRHHGLVRVWRARPEAGDDQ